MAQRIKIKKLGTFAGVFVPSILTILGVIMYMRLPWIVGQAGLYATLGIILVAHIISVSTGLSISSIATDKKVEAGGTYYMISRSLGLPIGGTLGLALFVGLSFSVSLYLIGFSEAFLSFFNMDTSLDSIRFTGFIVLSAVALITFISTKLAIKTQYLILTAMVLSLFSIFLGNHDYTPSHPNFFGSSDALPWIVLFGIFFPAVTGFEAGVSMSGDLANAKKAIPHGTILAIIIGLIAYIFLAFFFSYTVSSEQLINNPNVLFNIARIKYLVVAGIWGATLSSALGSILAAPRILQAISTDKITPKFFAKGYGGLNEPRHALLLTYVIALAGIMIGELNVIARVVTIFFIITYGFLNLSCFVENWASSDFRPSFRIHPIISIIGAVACFIVMIQLDFLAMIGATILLSAIFLYLKRKELSLRSGDAWNSVWASIVKSGLLRLKNNDFKSRNWRPNIILFSGGEKARPYLREIGTELIGKLGILTDFELIEQDKLKSSSANMSTNYENESATDGQIFKKRFACTNIYKGVENIAQLYGFSGIEPNTALLGFPNDESKFDDYFKMYKTLNQINYNSIFLKYNKEKGFGEKKKIDLWWDGTGNFFIYAVSLIGFLTSGFTWRRSHCRLHFIDNQNVPTPSVIRNIESLLASFRIKMEVIVHHNAVEEKSIISFITDFSNNADLIICEMPKVHHKNASYTLFNALKENPQTPSLMLLHAASTFEDISLFDKRNKVKDNLVPSTGKIEVNDTFELPFIKDVYVNDTLNKIKVEYIQSLNTLHEDFFLVIYKHNDTVTEELKNIIETTFKNLLKNNVINDVGSRKKDFYRIWNDMLFQVKELTAKIINTDYAIDSEIVGPAISTFLTNTHALKNNLPTKAQIIFDVNDYKNLHVTGIKNNTKRLFKYLQCRISGRAIEHIPLSKTADEFIRYKVYKDLNQLLIKHQNDSYTSVTEFQKVIEQFKNIFYKIEIDINKMAGNAESLQQYKNDILSVLQHISKKNYMGIALYKKRLIIQFKKMLFDLAIQINKPFYTNYLKKKTIKTSIRKEIKADIESYSQVWLDNMSNFTRQVYLDLTLQSLAMRFKSRIFKTYNEHLKIFKKSTTYHFDTSFAKLDTYLSIINKEEVFDFDLDKIVFDEVQLTDIFEDIFEHVKNYTEDIDEYFKVAHLENENALTDLTKLIELPAIDLPVKKHLDLIIDEVFYGNMTLLIADFNAQINKKIQKINNLLNLAKYNIDNVYINEQVSQKDEKSHKIIFINDFHTVLTKEKEDILSLIESFNVKLSAVLKEIFEPISVSILLKNSYKEKQAEKKQVKNKIKRLKPFIVIRQGFQKLAETLFYGRSEGILFAHNLKAELNEQKSAVYRMLKFVEDNSPKQAVIEKLPFYYKNLFNNKFTVNQRLWVGRQEETSKADNAIERYKNGSTGGILVLGERNSGKTSFCNYMAQKHFSKEKIYNIYPLKQGSCEPEDLRLVIAKVTGFEGSILEMMQKLPHNSVMVFNDLALWWERSEKGMDVIELIISLIHEFGNKCLFILNSNFASYTFINKLQPLNNEFLVIIRCLPFSSFELRHLILKRHQSSEMKFKFGKFSENMMIEWRYAHLFNKYFNYSDGVIGTALNGWLSNIVEVNEKEMIIKKPVMPDLSAFDMLPKDALVILVQLLLHRRLDKNRMIKIFACQADYIDNNLHFLLSAKLIVKMSHDIYMLNSFVEPHFVKYLYKKEII